MAPPVPGRSSTEDAPRAGRLRLAPAVTFHARGEAAFAWQGDTGDVCEMSRDVVALLMAFARGPALADAVCAACPCAPDGQAGIDPRQAATFVEVLAERGYLLPEGGALDVASRRVYLPRFTVFERIDNDVVVYARGHTIAVPGGAALFAAATGGRRTLGELWPAERFPEVLRLCRADVAALKLLPPGDSLPAWSTSTMPWPAQDGAALAEGAVPVPDPAALARYHDQIVDAEQQFEEVETTLSHLFRDPHRALGGERFGDRLASALVARGVPQAGARVLEVGGGLGWVATALRERLAPSSYLIVDRSPALARAQRARGHTSVVGDALALPVADAACDLVVSNEMAGDLGEGGALRLVDEIARVLAPGGVGYVSEFGHPSRPPVVSDHLDHDERSIRFGDLRRRAEVHGLSASLVPVPSLVGLDPDPAALATTRASFAALQRLFASRGARFPKRAWLIDEVEALASSVGIDPARISGLVSGAIGDRTMGLKPREFWALVVVREAG